MRKGHSANDVLVREGEDVSALDGVPHFASKVRRRRNRVRRHMVQARAVHGTLVSNEGADPVALGVTKHGLAVEAGADEEVAILSDLRV